MFGCVLLLAAVLNVQKNGVDLTVEAEPTVVDPARNVFVTLTVKTPADVDVTLPELGTRVRGFTKAESFPDALVTDKDGRLTRVVNWKLVPAPCVETYKIAPFVVGVRKGEADLSFVAGPVYFDPPPARKHVEGGVEIDPHPDRPPFSWRRFGIWTLWTLAGLLVFGLIALIVRYLMRRVREHLMSPIERARVELERLVAKGLPEKGLYKDYYVELTLVVRRYVQRQHGIKAPHLTTEEFFEATRQSPTFPQSTLELFMDFLRKADMVKFAGVAASVETSAVAAESARTYMSRDDEIVRRKGAEA